MNEIQRLREQIDACRPGSDDLARPELAELRQAAEQDRVVAEELARSQQFDEAVTATLQDVTVPAGLLDRILAAAKTADLVERATIQTPPGAVVVPVARTARSWSRRFAIALSGSLAAGLLIGLTAFALWSRQQPTISEAELSLCVDQWQLDVLAPQKAKLWKATVKSPVPKPLSVPATVLAKPQRWASFAAQGKGWSGTGVAIDLVPPGGPRAVLFVVSSPARFRVSTAPTTVLSLTGTTRAVAWQDPRTNLLYVLMVDEDRGQQLKQFLKLQPTA